MKYRSPNAGGVISLGQCSNDDFIPSFLLENNMRK